MADGGGPGVRQFWELFRDSGEIDLARFVRVFPDEASALAEAAAQAARERDARTRERLWRHRHRLLLEDEHDLALGQTLRQRRISLGLSERALAQLLAADGVHVLPQAIQRLETGSLSPLAVRPPSAWQSFVGALRLDPTLVMSMLEMSAERPRETQQFTRMARGATAGERAEFLTETREDSGRDTAAYLKDVRRALSLPPR